MGCFSKSIPKEYLFSFPLFAAKAFFRPIKSTKKRFERKHPFALAYIENIHSCIRNFAIIAKGYFYSLS